MAQETGWMLTAQQARWVRLQSRAAATNSNLNGARPTAGELGEGGLYLVKTPAGGIASKQTEACNILDTGEQETGETLQVFNPFSGDIQGDVNVVAGPWFDIDDINLAVAEDCPVDAETGPVEPDPSENPDP